MEIKMTDAELVEAVAREAMGWRNIEWRNWTQKPLYIHELKRSFSPLTDANDTQMVKDKLREMGWIVAIIVDPNGTAKVYLTKRENDNLTMAEADTESRAICEAAIKVTEQEELSHCNHVITQSSLRSMPFSCKKCGRLFSTNDGGS